LRCGSKLKLEIAKIMKMKVSRGHDIASGNQAKSIAFENQIREERRERRPVISGIERVSKPDDDLHQKSIPWVLSGIGVAILSTPKGVMTGARARQLGVGGEILCKVW
jgi:small subunit ribosomal protein S8